ncbi:MAG: hypothetical protein ACFFE4_01225 [Candidatus Thorarchaeota archaeon]
MNPIERSKIIKKEADEVLKNINLVEHCEKIGKVTYTGSYFLDLMMYPDIDLYLPESNINDIFNLAKDFAQYEVVEKIKFRKGIPGPLRNALYLSPRVEVGSWGRAWKIDIWAVNGRVINEKLDELIKLKNSLTTETRKLILEYKYSVLNDEGRTPMFSGIFIYRAILNEGMTDYNEITNYLKKNGIKL